MSSTVFVTAFVPGASNHRSLDEYMALGNHLLIATTPCPTIVFLDPSLILPSSSSSFPSSNNHVTVVPFAKEDLSLWAQKEKATAFAPHTTNPTKDTLEYFLVQCEKTEWLRRATVLRPGANEYVWIDFGIAHIFSSPTVLADAVHGLQQRIQTRCPDNDEKITVASCWPMHYSFHGALQHDIAWYFAGGVLGGSAQAITRFADAVHAKCMHMLEEQHTLTWEINVWYLVYLDHPDWFRPYAADHNNTILDGYA